MAMEAVSVSTPRGNLLVILQPCTVIRNYDGTLPAVVSSWDWNAKKNRTFELEVPHTIAYAANDQMVYLPYDGILGLDIIRWAFSAYSLQSNHSLIFFFFSHGILSIAFNASSNLRTPTVSRLDAGAPVQSRRLARAMHTHSSILQPSMFTVGLRHPAHFDDNR